MVKYFLVLLQVYTSKIGCLLMKKSFQLSAIAIAISLTSAVYADTNISDIDNVNVIVDDNDGGYGAFNVIKGVTNPTTLITSDVNSSGGTIINTNTTINGNLAVNGGTSTILTAAPVSTGTDLVIPTVNPAFSNTTQPFSQNRVDTQDQTRSVDNQVINQNKFQLNTSEQIGQQSWTTAQTASAQYDANGVIVPGSLTGPVLGATVDNGFVASSVNKVQDLTLGRNNTSEDYRLSITKTDNGVTNTTTVSAAGISTNQITLNGQDLATTIANGDATTLATANSYTDSKITAEAATRAAADTALNTRVDNETAARTAADTAIRNDIATKVTTNSLEVNGPSNFNGPVTVNNVKAITTVDQAGTPATTPEFGADVNGDGRPDTLIQKKEQTDTVTVQSQTQAYNENNLTFTAKTEKGTLTTTNQYTADIIYDQNGVATYGPNASNGQTVTPDLQTVAEDSIIVGKETANSETALTVRSKDATGESVTTVTSKSVATGNITAKAITLDGQDLATTIANGDAATLTSAKGYTDTTATTLRSEAAAETVRVNKAIVDGDAATLASAKGYTDTTATTLRSEAAAETVRVNKAIVDGDAATLTSANGYTDTKAAATLTSANGYTDTKAAATLASANAYTDGRANQLNTRIDDVQRTAYRGIAISLAAQQAVPSIGPGQVAIFGGVGHYEGETAGSIGVVTAFTDRLSASGAFGFAGGNEFGGRVGVAYVFGGK